MMKMRKMMEEVIEEDKYIYEECKVCDRKTKFLICADEINAICCECGYRVEIRK